MSRAIDQTTSKPSAPPPSRWLQPRDWLGGALAACVMVAVEGAYGLIALAPLGPAQAATGFLWAVYAAVVVNLVAVACGARGPMLSGPSSALALLVAPLLAGLMLGPDFGAAGGPPDALRLLAFLGLGVALAGLLQIAIAAAGLGAAIRYVPYPVHAGFMNAVAVLTALAVLPHALGVTPAAMRHGLGTALGQAHLATVAVAALTAWLALRPPRWTRRLPSFLVAFVGGTAAHHLLVLLLGAEALGPRLGATPLAAPNAEVWQAMAGLLTDGTLLHQAGPLLQFAVTVALIASLQSLMTFSVVNGQMQTRHSSARELFAQGLGNTVAGLVGALPSAGAAGRSSVNIRSGATDTGSRAAFAVGLLLVMALAGNALSLVPLGAIAGLFLAIARGLLDAWSLRATRVLFKDLLRGRAPPRSLATSYAVMCLVAGASILFSLAHGVAIGVGVAMLMFIRSNSRDPVRAVSFGDRRRSLKVRGPQAMEWLGQHGRAIALLELDGALFFGTADAVASRLEALAREADQIIIDFRRVSEIDATGARILMQAADAVSARGKHLMLASITPHDERMRVIRELDVHHRLADTDMFANADLALEHAEDRLLARLPLAADDGHALTLGQTMMGDGLTEEQLAHLSTRLVTRAVARGEAVFRRGDAADSLYVALRGQIGIWLPPDAPRAGDRGHRLVSFAPGVIIGEMGLLERRPRSADAVAEDNVELLELSRADYERLAAERPDILGRIFVNLSIHQSRRMRALTDELAAALALR